MGHSQSTKETTHRRIVATAAKRFREKGLNGVGVADLMKEAGLTVGGFYKHFSSRDDLVAEAIDCALGGWQREQKAGKTLEYGAVVDAYLSETHRDEPGDGCALSALAPEIARSDARTRARATQQLQDDIALLASLLPGRDKKAARARAILTQSALVGALTLARATSDKALSQEILETVRRLLRESMKD